MIHLSMAQALGIWGSLVEAYHGVNPYGGDTAEIYMYRLQPRNPMAEAGGGSGFARASRDTAARTSLYLLIDHFLCTYSDAVVEIDGMSHATWAQRSREDHRVHVKITRSKR